MGKAEELYRRKQAVLRGWLARFQAAELFAAPGLELGWGKPDRQPQANDQQSHE
jgi:hypothetical protein